MCQEESPPAPEKTSALETLTGESRKVCRVAGRSAGREWEVTVAPARTNKTKKLNCNSQTPPEKKQMSTQPAFPQVRANRRAGVLTPHSTLTAPQRGDGFESIGCFVLHAVDLS